MEEVLTFCCPSCLQHTSATVSLAHPHQRMVEDCQNCCAPVELDVEVRDGEIVRFDYRSAN